MFLVFIWGFADTMGLIFLTCSLSLLVSVLYFIGCSSIDTPLYWFDPWPTFYHCLLSIRRFLAKSRVHMCIFGQKSRIHAGVWPKSTYTCIFLAKSHVYMQMLFKQSRTSSLLIEFDVVGSSWEDCECGWVFLGSDVVCWMLLLWPETAFSLIFLWK